MIYMKKRRVIETSSKNNVLTDSSPFELARETKKKKITAPWMSLKQATSPTPQISHCACGSRSLRQRGDTFS